MQLVMMSDTHGLWEQVAVPVGDVLIHCGDITTYGRVDELQAFAAWLVLQPHPHKIVISGNHDWCFWHNENVARKIVEDVGATYLRDSAVTIDGIKFYGSPWVPKFFNWAWMRERGPDIRMMWNKIPDDTDVLVTHGPAAGKLDWAHYSHTHQGCTDLRDAIEQRVRPTVHCYGHIHSSYGATQNEHTIFVNCAVCNGGYAPVNEPFVLEI